MDPRRRLTAAIWLIGGLAGLPLDAAAASAAETPAPWPATLASPVWRQTDEAPADRSPTERPYLEVRGADAPPGRRAIAAANAAARARSHATGFIGGVQVFDWSPGQVYEVWTAPLRVTTLTLGTGETVLTKAAGDTVRWQIGEATSGSGASTRTHLLLKPLQAGLETNLVITTDRRVYFIALRSGSADAFNAAVAWEADSLSEAAPPAPLVPSAGPAAVVSTNPVVEPEGPVDARYRVEPQGRRPVWSPTSVFNDGRRTFIVLDPAAQGAETPALFALGADGAPEMVNYRQSGSLIVVDRVLERAELRIGHRRPQVVRIRRLTEPRS